MNVATGTTLDGIEDLTRRFGRARTELGERLSALEAELLAVPLRK